MLVWWLTLAPSNNRPWQSDVARTPYSEIHNGEVTIHNVRNFDYVTETDYHPVWETRTYQISQISGIDLFMDYWGSPAIAHTILSFEFSDNPPLAMSIETRKEVGETFGHSWFFSPI